MKTKTYIAKVSNAVEAEVLVLDAIKTRNWTLESFPRVIAREKLGRTTGAKLVLKAVAKLSKGR
jgi:hypothetical protein